MSHYLFIYLFKLFSFCRPIEHFFLRQKSWLGHSHALHCAVSPIFFPAAASINYSSIFIFINVFFLEANWVFTLCRNCRIDTHSANAHSAHWSVKGSYEGTIADEDSWKLLTMGGSPVKTFSILSSVLTLTCSVLHIWFTLYYNGHEGNQANCLFVCFFVFWAELQHIDCVILVVMFLCT